MAGRFDRIEDRTSGDQGTLRRPLAQRLIRPGTRIALTVIFLLLPVPARSAGGEEMAKSPRGAMLRSALLPGWGQFYTGHPLRGVAVSSIEAALVVFAWRERREANRDFDAWERTGDAAFLDGYDRRIGRSENLLSYGIGVYLYNIADAYVSAHLFDFESRITRRGGTGRTEVAAAVRF